MMKIKGTEGFLPVQTNPARPAGTSGLSRAQAQDSRYDQFAVSTGAAQDRGGFREMVASLSYQVRTYNTTGKIQELRRQVSSGEYQIEPRETAARMLLLMEEGE